jgi:hypothetical protein
MHASRCCLCHGSPARECISERESSCPPLSCLRYIACRPVGRSLGKTTNVALSRNNLPSFFIARGCISSQGCNVYIVARVDTCACLSPLYLHTVHMPAVHSCAPYRRRSISSQPRYSTKLSVHRTSRDFNMAPVSRIVAEWVIAVCVGKIIHRFCLAFLFQKDYR